jgi:hypothetical protein
MAALDFDAISSALATLFEDRIVMQINRAVVLANLLPVTPGTGKNIQWVARFGTSTGAVIADGVDVSVYNSDTKVPAVLQFGTYHDAFSITGKARAAAAAAGNPQELVDLFGEEIEESVQRLALKIAQDCYTGTGASDNINGLLTASGAAPGIAATGIYATINRGTYSQWAATVMANGTVGRPLTVDLMREMRRRIYTASGEKPDLIVTDPIQHEKYGATFGTNRRYLQDIYLRGQNIKLDGGYQVLEFDGIPVVEDVNHPTGKMSFLNTRHVNLKQLPSPSDALNMGKGSMALHGTPEEQYGMATTRLTARVQPLAITGDALKFALFCYPQMQVKRPNATGVIEDLT